MALGVCEVSWGLEVVSACIGQGAVFQELLHAELVTLFSRHVERRESFVVLVVNEVYVVYDEFAQALDIVKLQDLTGDPLPFFVVFGFNFVL